MTHLEPEQNKRRRATTINNAAQIEVGAGTAAAAAAQSTQSTNKTKLPLR